MSKKKKSYAPRLARSVRGGLRPQSGNRDMWWRKRLIAWMEEMHLGARLGRGRNYAQLGQVREMTIQPGEITAEVQGADTAPYQLSVKMPVLDAEKVWLLLHDMPICAAQIAARSLPVSLNEALLQHNLHLFPESRADMQFHCTCKDWTRPCKHILAALCLFTDAVAVDPLLLLRFRGIIFPDETPNLTPQTLPIEKILRLHPTPDAASVPRRLGALPYWRGTEDFRKTLEGAYHRAHVKAISATEGIVDLRFAEDAPLE